jgi:cell division protein FtsQ
VSTSQATRKRRRRASPVRKLRPFWLLLVALVVAAAGVAYWLVTWRALEPHTIDVSGNHVVPKETILQSARIDSSENMWLQNTGAMRARIEAIPYVDLAQIHRHPPDVLSIAVTERAPFAIVRGQGADVTVDHTLRVLQSGAALGSLPVFEVPNVALPVAGKTIASGAVATLARIEAHADDAHLDPESLAYDRFGDITLRLRSGVSVLLGDGSDLDKKLAMVEPILTQVQHGSRRIQAVDLRALSTPVVVYAK